MNQTASIALLLSLLCGCTAPAIEQRSFHISRITSDVQGGGDSAISPDGKRFLTTSRRSGNWDVWMYDLDSASWTQLTDWPSDEFEARWSPDATSIVFTSTRRGNKDIFLMDLAAGRTTSLTDDAEDDEYPVFSPDGSTIVYTGGRWLERRYYLVGIDGQNRRAVSAPAAAGACSFHPSGESLVCHGYDSGSGHVYVYPLDGGKRLQITDGQSWDYKPTVSPDARWVAFSRSAEAASDIWLMPFPAGNAFPLIQTEGDDRWPTWSAGGDKLLFHRLVDRGRAVQTIDLNSRQVTTLAGADENPGAASLAPSGKRVVYSSRAGGRERLHIRDIGTNEVTEVQTPFDASFPRWSPDGKQIAFAARNDAVWDIATLDVASGETRVWTDLRARGVSDVLDWSPDSRFVVFHASTEPFEANLYILDVTSGRVRNVTNDHWFSQSPAFTADGTGITFMSTRGGNWTWGFFLLDLASEEYKLLLGPDYVEKNYPRLSRRHELLWSEFGADGREYLSLRDSAGRIEMLTEAGTFARWPSFSPDGKSILYTAVDHRVEYWMAEGLTAADSPLNKPATALPVTTRQVEPETLWKPPADETAGAENRSPKRSSPVQLHHR